MQRILSLCGLALLLVGAVVVVPDLVIGGPNPIMVPAGSVVGSDGTVTGDINLATYDIYDAAKTSDAATDNVLICGENAYSQAATNTSGGDLYLVPGLGQFDITVDDWNNCAGDTVTVTVNGAASVLTAGVDWTAATSNNATATSLASAVDAVSGVSAVAVAAVVYVTPDEIDTWALDLAEGDATCTTLAEGAQGQVLIPVGSASAPGLAWAVDTDTGIYTGAAGASVIIGVAGSARLSVSNPSTFFVDLNMASNKVYSSTGPTQLGTTCATGATGDVCTGGAFNFQSAANFNSLSRHGNLIRARFGVADNYWFHYDSSVTEFQLVTTDKDEGGGTDGVVFSVANGTDDITYYGHEKYSKVKTGLTDAAGNAFVRIAVAQGAHVGGKITYSLHADDGTDYQVRNGTLTFGAVNKAGTETCDVQIAAASEAVAVSAGSLTSSFGCASSVADTVDISVTPNSSLGAPTPSTLEIHYRVSLDEVAAITDI